MRNIEDKISQLYLECYNKTDEIFNQTASEGGSISLATDNATISSAEALNESDTHCPLRFDGFLCWPRTPAGTVVTQECPDFIEGFSSKFLAHKTCMENGTWFRHPVSDKEWSNYTNCVNYDDFKFHEFVNELYIICYSTSLIALICSLAIFLSFKSLHCTRVRIHVQMFASLAFTCLTWLTWHLLIKYQTNFVLDNSSWCIGLHILKYYFMLANYMWMFCEAVHLYLVLVVVFVDNTLEVRWLLVIGWCTPLLFLIPYAVARYLREEDNVDCWMGESSLLNILIVNVILSLLGSFGLLIRVLNVIMCKSRPRAEQSAPDAMRKGLRATVMLVPLFGLQYLLMPVRPDKNSEFEHPYLFISAIVISLQGIVVSIMFCLATKEVNVAIRKLLNGCIPSIISPPTPPQSSTTTTTTMQLSTSSSSCGLGA